MRRAIPTLLAAVLLGGCVAGGGRNHPHPNPLPVAQGRGNQNADALVLSDDLAPYVPQWRREASTRLTDPFLLACHGGSVCGLWTCFPSRGHPMPVAAVAELLHAEHPGRPIVLLCCNAGGADIDVAGVYYARDAVWDVPDRYCVIARHGGVGSIRQFVTTRPSGGH